MIENAEVCASEATHWRRCIESHLTNPDVRRTCCDLREAFDRCVLEWRKVVGHNVQVRGDEPGDPPPQCAAHSCLVGECMRGNGYDYSKCTGPMSEFKHCVKQLFGSEYIS
jgi:hypothetical protein